jgi:hypothetical protein
MKKTTIYFIKVDTIEWYKRHHRGPYRMLQDAKNRKKCLQDNAGTWLYSIENVVCEDLEDGRFILGSKYIVKNLKFVEVFEDGTIEDNDCFSSTLVF